MGNDIKSFFEEQPDPIEDDFVEMLNFTREKLKLSDQDIVEEILRKSGLNDAELIGLIIESAWENLKMFRYASLLRDVDKALFSFIIGTIIKDIYVDREYDSVAKLEERLQLSEFDQDEIKKTNVIVDFLLYNYFSQLGSLDELASLMEDLDLDKDKVTIFLELLKANKEGLEKYFLFFNLLIITEELNSLRKMINDK